MPETYEGIELPASYHLNLKDEPPRPESDGDGDIEYVSGPYLETDNGRFVLLQPNEEPTLGTCREVTRYAESIYLEDVAEGANICLETTAGHIALITYQGVSPQSDPSSYIALDITVWRNATTAQP
ncbi:hypothetical protein [Streptomyces sp. MAR4 CNX-425]|uniref:hypothetical protein n=1 Tax=Streptomyces sp. MAR4 CNX-425 TaxID=3406343 RepID=UPI003B4FFA45